MVFAHPAQYGSALQEHTGRRALYRAVQFGRESDKSKFSIRYETVPMFADQQIFALSTKANPEQIGRIAEITMQAAPFFQRSSVLHVSPTQVTLLDSGEHSLPIVLRRGSR